MTFTLEYLVGRWHIVWREAGRFVRSIPCSSYADALVAYDILTIA